MPSLAVVSGAFQNSIEWLMQQVAVTSTHADYLKSGEIAASIMFHGEAALVRELLDRFAELAEAGQAERRNAA